MQQSHMAARFQFHFPPDVQDALRKMADRLAEHPDNCAVLAALENAL